MLQELIRKYEDKITFKLADDHEPEYINYLKDLQKEPKKLRYIELRLTDPKQTQKQLAEKLGITPKTICEWQKDSNFIRTLVELTENMYGLKRVEIIEMLFTKAKEGDYKAMQLFLKYTQCE